MWRTENAGAARKEHRIGVRELAEFALEGGDLFVDNEAAENMQQGLMAHMQVQKSYPEGWQAEVTLERLEHVNGVDLHVYGRMDGVCLGKGDERPVIEEIKSTRVRDPSRIAENSRPVHWAQAEIYAYILSMEHGMCDVEVRLTYKSTEGPSHTYTRVYDPHGLSERFFAYAAPYARWITLLDGWEAVSRPTMRALTFPYGEYRPGQRDMAASVYRAIKKRKLLLCEAPTGIGKTSAALFPAIKAIGSGLADRIFYLTARTTARKAAEDALERMREKGLRLRCVTLTAKEKICFMPEMKCRPDECPYAAGYYDRRREALNEAVSLERLGRAEIEALAAEHGVCPFELSLDLCETADCVICDYNYVFDPVVHLRRFFDGKTDSVLLIDEAHHLAERARDMLSAELNYADLLKLRRMCARAEGKETDLYQSLARLIRLIRSLCKPLDMPSAETEPPNSLYTAVDEFALAAKEKLGTGYEYASLLKDVYFAALDYQRACDDFDGNYRALLFPDKHAYRVRLWCADPAEHLRRTMERTAGACLFSGTLTPMDYYARISGVRKEEGDGLISLDSPFPPENLLVLRMDTDTRYRVREETAGEIAKALYAMCAAHTGNYMACFPSYAYLQMVYERFAVLTGGKVRVIKQEPGMKDEERSSFLEMLRPEPGRSLIAFIVMGGIFSEGVDLPGDRLSGAAIIGVGFPQPDFERQLLCEAWNDSDEGMAYAYVYPGMEKVLQAAGRVIRSEEDKGVILLLDDRYMQREDTKLFPRHWKVRKAHDAGEAHDMMSRFWNEQ